MVWTAHLLQNIKFFYDAHYPLGKFDQIIVFSLDRTTFHRSLTVPANLLAIFKLMGTLIWFSILYTIAEPFFLFPENIKTCLLRLIEDFIKELTVVVKYLDRKNIENPLLFDDLMPIEDADQTEVYEKALNWALKNRKIKNIAITGPYGSGKSSLIKTFEKKHAGYRYLNISLASFQEAQLVDGKPVKLNNMELQEQHRLVELSILQQMFYRVETARVPDSRFNRIKHLRDNKVFVAALTAILGLLSFLILIKPSFLQRFSWFPAMNKGYTDYILYAAILMALPLVYKVFAYVLRLLNTSKFNKINLTDGEIEFDPKSETSVLNKHLDEILYFFEVTEYDVVIFEDLDRFNDPEIFTKLREINILVNKSLQISRHIVFVYAIKDEMFKDKSRTKFFDFLIPVIPVITAANSYELFKRKFNNKHLSLGVTDKFISAITLYVDDMRTLKNIFNEFMIYSQNLKIISPNPDKLLSLIVFKNAYPNDFAELHEDKGILIKAFDAKPGLIKSALEAKDRQIAVNNKRIELLRERQPLHEKELRAVYLLRILSLMDKPQNIYIEKTYRTFEEVYENEDYFEWLRQQKNVTYQGFNVYGQLVAKSNNFSFEEIEQAVYPSISYEDRRDIVNGNAKKEIDELLHVNNELGLEKRRLETASLQQLIADQQDQLNGLPEDFTVNKLLVYLVRNGYIDESYRSLISHFYEGSLSNRDMKFILSIRDKNPKDFEYELDMLNNLCERLEVEDFQQDSIYNLKLAIFLTANRTQFSEKYKVFVAKIQDGTALTLRFIEQLRQHNDAGDFFKVLLDYWVGFGDFIFDHPDLSQEQKVAYLIMIVKYCKPAQWKKLDKQGSLSNFTKTTSQILQAFADGELPEIFKAFVLDRDLSFDSLESPADVPALFDWLIDEERYVLNASIIKDILSYKGTKESQNFALQDTSNYTAVQVGNYLPLINMVNKHLPDYVETLLLGRTENTKESEKCVIQLLNQVSLPENSKIQIIKQQDTVLNKMDEVPKELWDNLLAENKIIESWANILSYFDENGLTESLITFLNQQSVSYSLGKTRATSDKDLNEEKLKKLWLAILTCDKLDDTAYDTLLTNCPWYYNDLSLDTLSQTKIRSLIQRRTIRLNTAIFTKVNTSAPELRGLLIARNFTDYQASIANYPVEIVDFIYLLGSNLSKSEKDALLPLINDEQLRADDELVASYRNQALTSSQKIVFSPETIQILLRHADISVKSQLLQRFGHRLDSEQLKGAIAELPNFAPLLTVDGKDHVIVANSIDSDILKLMKKAGLILDYQRKKQELIIQKIKA